MLADAARVAGLEFTSEERSEMVPGVEYFQMSRLRMLLMESMAETVRDVDVLLAPFFTPAGDAFLRATNATGHPAVSVPTGINEHGTPTGILFVGSLFGEARMLALAKGYQDQTDHHQKRPPIA